MPVPAIQYSTNVNAVMSVFLQIQRSYYRTFHLQENSWVLLINGHQLDVGNCVNNSHCQTRHSQGDGQKENIIAQRDDGKYYGDNESRDK